jgi:hypothetical protein
MKLAVACVAALAAILVSWFCVRGASDRVPRPDAEVSSVPKVDSNGDVLPAATYTTQRELETPSAAPESPISAESSSIRAERSESVLLYGYVRGSDGSKIDTGSVGIVDRAAERSSTECSRDGTYSFPALKPGRYWISASAQGWTQVHRVLDLDGTSAEVRFDLELLPMQEIRVRAVDPSGTPMAFPGFAAATLDAPSEWLDAVRGSEGNPVGVGRFRNRSQRPELPEEYLGRIELDVAPPVYVSLLRYQRVIATQRVDALESDVVFVVDPASPLLEDGSVRFRFVDSETRAVIAPGSAMFAGCTTRIAMPPDGVFHFGSVAPGLYELSSTVSGHEGGRRQVRVEPGSELDLGDISLEPGSSISGRVVDDEGQGVRTSIDYVELDPNGKPVRSFGSRAVTSADDGSFRILGISRRAYRLSVRDEEHGLRLARTIVDLSAGSVENVRIQVAHGVPLILQSSDESWRDTRVRVATTDGAELLSMKLWTPAPTKVLLAPGTYEATVTVRDVESRRIPIVIGSEPVELLLP